MWKNGSSEARAPFMHNVVYGSYGFEADKGDQNLQNACEDYLLGPIHATNGYVFAGNEFIESYWEERYFLDRVLENYRGSVYIVQGFHDWNVDPHMAVPTINTLLDHGIEAKVLMGQWDHDYPDRPDYQKQRWTLEEAQKHIHRWLDLIGCRIYWNGSRIIYKKLDLSQVCILKSKIIVVNGE